MRRIDRAADADGFAAISAMDPPAIAVPSSLWLLTGISATSLAGTPLILSNKADKTPSQKAIRSTRHGDPADANLRLRRVLAPIVLAPDHDAGGPV